MIYNFGIKRELNLNDPNTDPWMAPEATASEKPFYGHAADVYGFGLKPNYCIIAIQSCWLELIHKVCNREIRPRKDDDESNFSSGFVSFEQQ